MGFHFKGEGGLVWRLKIYSWKCLKLDTVSLKSPRAAQPELHSFVNVSVHTLLALLLVCVYYRRIFSTVCISLWHTLWICVCHCVTLSEFSFGPFCVILCVSSQTNFCAKPIVTLSNLCVSTRSCFLSLFPKNTKKQAREKRLHKRTFGQPQQLSNEHK